MNYVSQILKDLPIQQAKYQTGQLTGDQFENYLLEKIDYCAEISSIESNIPGMTITKDYLWAILEFLIK